MHSLLILFDLTLLVQLGGLGPLTPRWEDHLFELGDPAISPKATTLKGRFSTSLPP